MAKEAVALEEEVATTGDILADFQVEDLAEAVASPEVAEDLVAEALRAAGKI